MILNKWIGGYDRARESEKGVKCERCGKIVYSYIVTQGGYEDWDVIVLTMCDECNYDISDLGDKINIDRWGTDKYDRQH